MTMAGLRRAPLRLLVFDLDGTLVDSEHHIVAAQQRAFAAVGLGAPSRAASLAVVGLSLREAFTALVGPDGPLDSLADAYKAAWHDVVARPDYREALYPGAAETIATLAAREDVMLGIATGKSRRGVDRLLAALGWHDLFATIQTADDHPSKPHPSMLVEAMRETGVAAVEATMIGDTSYDMAMAAAAGIVPVGVAWGFHEPDALRAAGAAIVVDSFAALLTSLHSETGRVVARA